MLPLEKQQKQLRLIVIQSKQRDGKVIIKKVDNCKAETLIPQITANVSKNTTIYSDSFKTYNAINKKKYIHKKINHSKEFVNKEDKTIHTNGIENIYGDKLEDT